MRNRTIYTLCALTLIVYSCNNPVLEPNIVPQIFNLDIKQEAYQIYKYTIIWNEEVETLSYSIEDGSSINISNPGSGLKLFTEKSPGIREKLIFNGASLEGDQFIETLYVYVSPIEEVKWNENNSISTTSQQNSLNLDTYYSINDLEFFFSELSSNQISSPPSLDLDNGNPSENWVQFYPESIDNCIHNKPRDAYYAYTIKYIDPYNNYRYSLIEADIGISQNLQGSYSSFNLLATTKKLDRIYLTWTEYDSDDFYNYEIWRGPSSNFSINDSDAQLLHTISDSDIVLFEDRNNIGTRSWYYRIILKNIFGKTKISDSKLGRARI